MNAVQCAGKLWIRGIGHPPRTRVSRQGITMRPGDIGVSGSTLTLRGGDTYGWVRRDGTLTLVSLGRDENQARIFAAGLPNG